MSNPAKPGWPDPSALPFMMFGAQAPTASPSSQPLAQGMDLFKQFWSNLPGGNAVPGFLVPTVDVDELDKRLSDLRAAEKWLEVNLNMLRATIQGLEVQRNTIAAIHSLSAMAEGTFAPKTVAKETTSPGLPSGWPVAASPPAPSPAPSPAASSAASPAPAGPLPEPEQPAMTPADEGKDAATPLPAGLAANNWLGFLQDQFSKVAQAALVGVPAVAVAPKAAPRKAVAKTAAKKAKRRPAARKT